MRTCSGWVCLLLLAGTCCAERFPLLLFNRPTLAQLQTITRDSADAAIQRNARHSVAQQKLEALLARTMNNDDKGGGGAGVPSAAKGNAWQQRNIDEGVLQHLSLKHLLLPGQQQSIEHTDLWPLHALATNLQDGEHARPTTKKLLHILDTHWSHLRAAERLASHQQQRHSEGESQRPGAGPWGSNKDKHAGAQTRSKTEAPAPARGAFAAIEAWADQLHEQAGATSEGACLCSTPLTCRRGCTSAEAAIRAARSFFNVIMTADLIFDACSSQEQAFLAEQVLWSTGVLRKLRQRASLPPVALNPVAIAVNEAIFAGSLFATNVRSHYSAVAARVSASVMRIDALASAQLWLEDAWSHLRMAIKLLSHFAPDGSLDGDLSLSLTTSQFLLETWLMAQNSGMPDAYSVHPLGWVRRHARYVRAILPPSLWARRRRQQLHDAKQQTQQSGGVPVIGVPAVGEACETRRLACSPAMQLRFVDRFAHQSGEGTWLADRISEAELFGMGAAKEEQEEGEGGHICVFSLLAELAVQHPRLPPIAPFVRRTEAMRLHRFHHKGLVVVTQGGARGTSDTPVDASPRQLLFALRAGVPSADTSLLASTLAGSAYAHMIPELMRLVHAPAFQEGSFTFTPHGDPFIVAPTGHAGNALFLTPAAALLPFNQPTTTTTTGGGTGALACPAGFESMAPESLWAQGAASQTRDKDKRAQGDSQLPAHTMPPQVLYSSSRGSQVMVVASTHAAYAPAPSGIQHPGLLCSVRVAFLPFPDTLLLVDMVMLRGANVPQAEHAAAAPASAHLLFRSADPWQVDAQHALASTATGHSLLVAKTLVVDAKGHRALQSVDQPESPSNREANADTGGAKAPDDAIVAEHTQLRTASRDTLSLIVTHKLLAANGQVKRKANAGHKQQPQLLVLGTLLAGRSQLWTAFDLTCQDCTLNAAKRGRMRLQATLSCNNSNAEDEECRQSFPLHISRQEACPI